MSAEAISSIMAVGDELVGYTDNSRAFDTVYGQVTERMVSTACYDLFDYANKIAERSDWEVGEPPQFAITERMLKLANSAHRPPIAEYGKIACFAAELRFARSLARHKHQKPVPSRMPAAVLFDDTDRPFAYQKADGHPTAYTWRSARIDTEAGPRIIPSEAVISVVYGTWRSDGYVNDPRRQHKGEGIIPLRMRNARPDEIYFQRLTLGCMPLPIRKASLRAAITHAPSLVSHFDEACSLTGSKVANQALAALQSRKVIE